MARQQTERQIEELQSRVRRKEAEWMAEYDRNVHALLEIIKHNEEEKEQLKAGVERWKAAAEAVPPPISKMTRSSQTETPLRPEKTALRTNSVRFAKDEKVSSVDAKTKANIARMQLLFEQLQASSDHRTCMSKSVDQANRNAAEVRESSGRRSVELGCSFKTIILERLQEQQPESSVVRRRQHATTSTGRTIETQTDDIPAPKQGTPSVALRQGLEERNRLLHERLASQQKVLDHLLQTKLQQANGNRDQNDLVPFTASDTHFAVNGQGKAQNKLEQSTVKPIESATSNRVIQIDAVPAATERRPLSPLAA
ncbi:hypothetical protein V7S43_012229 [Phytophthora oleae]|uniref:Uncharacterized protein n=1 Tax=Phytophthora oleae TaxID=2107226 RepID=A0ABD3FA23_9STRA